jgi:hypothetical protein
METFAVILTMDEERPHGVPAAVREHAFRYTFGP